MGAGNRVSMLCRGEAIGHGLHDRLLQCAATAQIQRRIAAERGRTGLLENSKDGGLKHLTTTKAESFWCPVDRLVMHVSATCHPSSQGK